MNGPAQRLLHSEFQQMGLPTHRQFVAGKANGETMGRTHLPKD